MLKLEEIVNPRSTWNKAAFDEPLFILRAQDVLMPAAVQKWIDLAIEFGVPEHKIAEANAYLKRVEEWAKTHSRKTPD